MASPNNRTTSVQLEIANIHDYLKGIVDLTQYHQRKALCQTLNTNKECQAIHTQFSRIFSRTMTASEALTIGHNSEHDVSSRVKVTSQLTWQRRTTSPAESMSSIDSAYMSSPPSPGLDNGFIDNVYDDLNEGFESMSSASGSPSSSVDYNQEFSTRDVRQFVWDISEILGYDPSDGIPAVAPSKSGLPVFGQSSGVTVPHPVPETTTVADVLLPDSLLDNNFSVSTSDAVPDLSIKNGVPVGPECFFQPVCPMPPSIPTYGTPLPTPWCGGLLESLFEDPLCGVPVPDPVFVPVTNQAIGFPVDFPPPQVVPSAPSDFPWFPETDVKSSFYEAL